jgi:hypothetical protein
MRTRRALLPKLAFLALRSLMVFLASAAAACVLGCGLSFAPAPQGALLGRGGVYDYSPTAIQTGDVQQFWWCGEGVNPYFTAQLSDTILYESINLTTGQHYGPLTVFGETPGAWDSEFTCNPKVVRGQFDNPLGDGKTYTYALYYVATASPHGVDNSVGVAFSNDGMTWKKYPEPVIPSTSTVYYGVGEPAVYNQDQKSSIVLFYENDNPGSSHLEATSTDGVHFTTLGTLTTNGIEADDPNPTWGDMAYDPVTGYWYAAFNLPYRREQSTGYIAESGQPGFQVYRIPNNALLTGSTPWEMVWQVDTNLTGYESNFIPGFLRDMYGNLNVGMYPKLEIFPSISNPAPPWNATPTQIGLSSITAYWDIGEVEYNPSAPPLALNLYSNATTYEVTTGWIDPKGGFQLQSTLGHLYPAEEQGATVALFSCKEGSTDYFVSTDSFCGLQHIQGLEGYAYVAPVAGLNLVPLYSCSTGESHFVSTTPACNGQTNEGLLAYALP